jgi:AcrR family transcriptional regulator
LVRQRRSTHFSLRDLAERVGVTQSAIYRHFDDLDDLLSTLCRQGFDALAETERQILVDSPDPSVRLRALMRFARGEVRDHIVSHKNDHGPSYRPYRALVAVETSKNRLSRDFQSRSIFDFCNSIGAKRTLAK